MDLIQKIYGSLIGNQKIIKDIAKSKELTYLSWQIMVSSIIGTAILSGLSYALFKDQIYLGIPGNALQVLNKSNANILNLLIIGIIVNLFFYFLMSPFFAALTGLIGEFFKSKLTMMDCIRIMGFVSTLSFIVGVVNFVAGIIQSFNKNPVTSPTIISLIDLMLILWMIGVFLNNYFILSGLSYSKYLINVFISIIIIGITLQIGSVIINNFIV